ncbi:hypothetical protein [Kitasatospora sp. NPDC093679]|uniref:hypothetical protein n=1 Tax=Kitasatospora sp. NPDC093679 TaxID=3154983 RepID=UPI003429163A
MAGAVLLGLLVLAAAGAVCVVWAARGAPRGVRAVAAVTIVAGEVLRQLDAGSGGHPKRSGGDGD